MKFKIGDKVRVVNCTIEGKNCINFNKVSTITEINYKWVFPYKLDGTKEKFREDELELVEKQLKKSDLENGDYCVFRNGKEAIKVEDYLMGECATSLSQYNNRLEHNFNPQYDIVRVDHPTEYKTIYKNDEILDSTEKKYLAAVIRPFKDRIESITKIGGSDKQYIRIKQKESLSDGSIALPYFKSGTMYVGMKPNKVYTLEELGL